MASYNKVLLMGNLTRDVELKHVAGNQPVAEIGLAVNRRYRTKEGEEREETTFVDCEAWGRTAEVMKQYLAKGRPVFIEGRLKLDQWKDKDGQNRSKMRVVIENFQFIGGPASGGAARGGAQDRGSNPQSDSPSDSQSGSQSGSQSDSHAGPQSGSRAEEHIPTQSEDIPF